MLSIDKYAYSNRWAEWSPLTKAGIWLGLMILAFQPLLWLKFSMLICVAIITVRITQVSWRQYVKWFYAILPFLFLSILGIIFTVSQQKQDLLIACHWGQTYFGLSKTMLPVGAKIGIQAFSAIVGTYWFALSTPFTQIISLLHRLHLPDNLIEITMLMYRFIFIFIESCEQIYHAQKLRFGYDTIGLTLHSSGILAQMLFQQVIVNYRKMELALAAKLYDGEFRIS